MTFRPQMGHSNDNNPVLQRGRAEKSQKCLHAGPNGHATILTTTCP
jgi:hypothetical protein